MFLLRSAVVVTSVAVASLCTAQSVKTQRMESNQESTDGDNKEEQTSDEKETEAEKDLSLGPLVPFLENTDVFWTVASPIAAGRSGLRQYDPPYVIEANLFPHLILYQNYSEVLGAREKALSAETTKETAIAFSGTPGVRLRMLFGDSKPVRTPTFTPRIDIQVLRTSGLKARVFDLQKRRESYSAGTDDPDDILRKGGGIGLYEFHLRAAHYSNGQDGCISSLSRRDSTGDCETVPLTRETINLRDGSFSTNFLSLGLNYAKNRIDSRPVQVDEGEEWHANREIRVGLEVEQHWNEIGDYYSKTRANAVASVAWRNRWGCSRRAEVSANGTIGLDDSIKSNSSISAQASCFWSRRHGGLGAFVRVVAGQDYYNVHFLNRINRLHVGVTYSQAGFFRFVVPRKPVKTENEKPVH